MKRKNSISSDFGGRWILFVGLLRNLPKFAYAVPSFKWGWLQRIRDGLGFPTATHITKKPFELGTELKKKVEKFGLEVGLSGLSENGYVVLEDMLSREKLERLRELILEFSGQEKLMRVERLLGKDPLFEELVLDPKLMTLVEIMCGKGALLSKITGRVIENNMRGSGLHVSQKELPHPYPEHNQMVTFVWSCDSQSDQEGGITCVPGSQKHRCPPHVEEKNATQKLETIESPVGSVTVFDGALWHGRRSRQCRGQQVLLYVTYCRLAIRPQEQYQDLLESDWIKNKSFDLRVLLGLEDGLDTEVGVVSSIDNFAKFARMTNWSKS